MKKIDPAVGQVAGSCAIKIFLNPLLITTAICKFQGPPHLYTICLIILKGLYVRRRLPSEQLSSKGWRHDSRGRRQDAPGHMIFLFRSRTQEQFVVPRS